MRNTQLQEEQMSFRQVDGVWRQLDCKSPTPPTLADVLSALDIIVDDFAQFARIIRELPQGREMIEYRAYGGIIRIYKCFIKND